MGCALAVEGISAASVSDKNPNKDTLDSIAFCGVCMNVSDLPSAAPEQTGDTTGFTLKNDGRIVNPSNFYRKLHAGRSARGAWEEIPTVELP